MTEIIIKNSDCLEELPKLKEKSIDLVITDPPYFLGFTSYAKNTTNRQDWGNHTLLIPLFEKLFSEFARLLKDDGRLLMFTDWRTYPTLYLTASKFMKISNLICWDFGWIKAGTQFRFTHELILHATMIKTPPPRNRSTSDVWRIKPVNYTTERNHPAEKPTDLIDFMLEQCAFEGMTVLDPFLGSGTTAISCKEHGLKCIAYEINTNYYNLAKKRVEATKAGVKKLTLNTTSAVTLEKFLV